MVVAQETIMAVAGFAGAKIPSIRTLSKRAHSHGSLQHCRLLERWSGQRRYGTYATKAEGAVGPVENGTAAGVRGCHFGVVTVRVMLVRGCLPRPTRPSMVTKRHGRGIRRRK